MSATTLSFEDLYGGKICAALDRQHPRDLFDVKLLFENEGLTDKIRKKPKLDLLELTNVEELTGIRWKLINLQKMKIEKHAEAYKKLKEYLIS